jgi:hypothetical protein
MGDAMRRLLLKLVLVLSFLPLPGRAEPAPEKPKVRTVTAFVKLEPARPWRAQVQETLVFLRQARAAYQKAGYDVQTVRLTTQAFWQVTSGMAPDEALRFWRDYDALAEKEGFDTAIGPAVFSDAEDLRRIEFLGEILRATKIVNGSVVVGGEDGVYWNAVQGAARLIKSLAESTPRSQGNFRFSAIAMLPEGAPFYPGSWHSGEGKQFAVGLQSATVVAEAFRGQRNPAAAQEKLIALLGDHAREVERIARALVVESGWGFLGVDLSPAPLKDASIGAAMESLIGGPVGGPGTLTAAAAITEALQTISVKRAGYSGLMLPVLEDSVLARRWSEGALTLDSLLSYSAVCGTGLDVVPLPGDVTEQQLGRIIGDVASLAVKLRKPLSARLLPVAGKKAGQSSAFDDPFLVNAVLQPLK